MSQTLIDNPAPAFDTPRDAEGKILLVGLGRKTIAHHLAEFGIEPK